MMNNDDKVLKDFFSDMKSADSREEVPDYRLFRPKKNSKPLFYAVAASFVLLAVVGWYLSLGNEEPVKVEIVVIEKNVNSSFSLMTRDETIEEWESPTQSLIDDF